MVEEFLSFFCSFLGMLGCNLFYENFIISIYGCSEGEDKIQIVFFFNEEFAIVTWGIVGWIFNSKTAQKIAFMC